MNGEVPPPSDKQQPPPEVPPPEPSRLDTADMGKEFSKTEAKGEAPHQEIKGTETGEKPEADAGKPEKAGVSDQGRLDTADMGKDFSKADSKGEASQQEMKGTEPGEKPGAADSGKTERGEAREPSRMDTTDMGKEFSRAGGPEPGRKESLPEAGSTSPEKAQEQVYTDPLEGRDFAYQKMEDHLIGYADEKTGNIYLSEDLKEAPSEVRIPHYEHEKVHQDAIRRGEDYTFEEEYDARMKQDTAWQSLKKPGETDGVNDGNHDLLYDENGGLRSKVYVRKQLEATGRYHWP